MDLSSTQQRQEKLERIAAAVEAERNAECTFRPAVNARSASLGRLRRSSIGASAEGELQASKLRSSILLVRVNIHTHRPWHAAIWLLFALHQSSAQ